MATTLESIQKQSYTPVEVIVVDSFSTDRTAKIAIDHGVTVIRTRSKLLGARKEGFLRGRGEYALLLDSDQVLHPTAIDRCVSALDEYDMVALEERSFNPRTWVQRLFQADRKMTHEAGMVQLDPLRGSMLPRFFKSKILREAFQQIPTKLFRNVVAHDHAIIYLEAIRISSQVGVVANAIYSQEPENLLGLWTKNFRYGTTTALLRESPYWSLIWKKTRLREGRRGLQGVSSSNLLLLLKFVPYAVGLSANIVLELAKSSFTKETTS